VKQLITIILSVSYLVYTTGINVCYHYCMGKQVNASLFSSSNTRCNNCGMQKQLKQNKGCCKDVCVTIKSSKSHLLGNIAITVDQPFQFHAAESYYDYPGHVFSSAQCKLIAVHGPPLSKRPLFLQYSNFRI